MKGKKSKEANDSNLKSIPKNLPVNGGRSHKGIKFEKAKNTKRDVSIGALAVKNIDDPWGQL